MKQTHYKIIYEDISKDEIFKEYIKNKNFKKEVNKKLLVKNKDKSYNEKSIDKVVNDIHKVVTKKLKQIDKKIEKELLTTKQRNKVVRERNELKKTLFKTVQYKNTFNDKSTFKNKSQINKLVNGYYTQNRKRIHINKELQEKFITINEQIKGRNDFTKNLKYIKYQPDNIKSKSINIGNFNSNNYIDTFIQLVTNTPKEYIKNLVDDIKNISNKHTTYFISNYGLRNYTSLDGINDKSNVIQQHNYNIEEIGLSITIDETNSGRFYISSFKVPNKLPSINEIQENRDVWLRIVNNTQFIHIISLQKSQDIVNVNDYEDDFLTLEYYYQQLQQLVNQGE